MSWSRSLPWVLLGLRNAPRTDSAASTAEVVFGTPLQIPGLCFQDEHSQRRTAAEQLDLARSSVAAFSPENIRLKEVQVVSFCRQSIAYSGVTGGDRLGKPGLTPRYTGPFKVIRTDWEQNTFRVSLGRKEDTVSLSRLKAASNPGEAT